MSWLLLAVLCAAIVGSLAIPSGIRAFRRWRLRRKAPGLRPYDQDLRKSRGPRHRP